MNQTAGPISLLVLIALGIGVLWSVRLAYRAHGASSDDVVRLVLTIAGWLLILVGLLGTAVQVTGISAVLMSAGSAIELVAALILAAFPCGIVLAIASMAVGRFRSLESRAYVKCLSAAAVKGIPLEQASRAMAMERVDDLGIRSARLAASLEAGKPLSIALHESRVPLPLDAELAVRLGIETGDLATSLAEISKPDDDAEYLVRSIIEKFFYLALVVSVLVGIVTFIMLKIVPVMNQLFREFETSLPYLTRVAIDASDFVVSYHLAFWPFFLIGGVVLLVGALHYVGWLPRDVPILTRLTLRFDSALVLRSLAVAVRQSRPLSQMVYLLAAQYPKWSVRARLLAAGHRISAGRHWCDAMEEAGLLRATDTGVLRAAERNGNLAWALHEMADHNLRRLAYRMRLWLNVLFPMILVGFGLIVAIYVVGLFVPLVTLITELVEST